jgi:D-psicose/D-tagatose/L-ribulose 3-epimerase
VRISLCNEVIGGIPFAAQCELAALLGYDGLEIAPFTLGEEPHRLPAAERQAMRKAAASAGIAITGLHYLLRAPAGLSITTADEAVRKRTIGVMGDLCGLAADLGASILVHGSPDQRKLEPGNEAAARQRGADAFAAVAEAAGRHGVIYCIEPLSRDQTAFINTVAEAAEIVRAVNNRALRTMLDCSSAARAETESVPDLLGHWVPTGLIAHVHFNDPNREGPGDGELDFAPVLAALEETRYAGNAAIEPFVYKPDGPGCAERGIKYIRGLQGRAS